MARVLSNNISLQMAAEASVGVLPGSPVWFLLEPNPPLGRFGPEIPTVARQPISKNRQTQKGTPVDLDSAVEFDQDLTMDSLEIFGELFMYAQAANFNTLFRGADAVAGGYTIPAATAAQAGKFQFVTTGPKTLVYARGYAISANNGLKVLSADLASTDTTLQVAGNSVETPPSNALVELAGIRAATGDLAITVSGAAGSITSGNNGVGGADQMDFTTIGVFVGQCIHVGGTTAGNQFSAGVGYVRITAIAADQIDFDKMRGTLATDPGTGETIDLLYGRFWRNVDVDADSDDSRYQEISQHIEATFPDLGGVGTDNYEYAIGNYANQISFNLPLTSKATMGTTFLGIDTEVPTGTRKTGASTPVNPLKRVAFNTSSSIVSIVTDATAVADTVFKSGTLTINNNVNAEKGLGRLGAFFVNVGRLDIQFEAQMVFASAAIPTAIRNNTSVTFDAILKNDDGGFCLDLPAMTLGGGDREYPTDQSVLINTTGILHEDATLGTSIGISTFPVLPA